jgi:hypothetical protein
MQILITRYVSFSQNKDLSLSGINQCALYYGQNFEREQIVHRKIIEFLKEWRKTRIVALILQARQAGETYFILEFGRDQENKTCL